MPETLVPKGKLDAVTATADASAGETDGAVNGPEGGLGDWETVDWSQVEKSVRRLRERIFTASQEGDWGRVRSLQKLMLRSRANTLLSVRRVTQVNAGRKTAGVDGQLVLTPPGRMELVRWVQRESALWTARPVRRVHIPKAGGKKRPLGIPVIVDRVLQAQVVNALEPEWEPRFEPNSYGFRPGRGCQDAIAAIFQSAKGRTPQRQWVLDADLKAAFDRIDHRHLLSLLGFFPARAKVAGWLKAGVVEKGGWSPTGEGTPQGGVVSPLLLNIALHGMESAAGVRYYKSRSGVTVAPHSPLLVRYADDLVALCHSRDEAEVVKQRLALWLTPRGLSFNEDKTRIVHLSEGFDFLGFNVKRYNRKLLIQPSKMAINRIRQRLRAEMRSLRGSDTLGVIRKMNPIIRGWAAYYRTVAASKTFRKLDRHMWVLIIKWVKRRHLNKSRGWVTAKYFGKFNHLSSSRLVFGDRETGAYLHRFAWTKIVRHKMVKDRASPDDPSLAAYWAQRRRSPGRLPLRPSTERLLVRQEGRCPVCRRLLLIADTHPQSPEQWEQWMKVTATAMRSKHIVIERIRARKDGTGPMYLMHSDCHKRLASLLGSHPAT
jgi:RNA-directed DNA polymerase